MALTLRPYQIECFKFLQKRNGRAIIGDPPGSGKSAEGLSWLINQPEHMPVLIITTASTKRQWLSNWKDWIGNSPIYLAQGQTPYKIQPGRSCIINWDILTYWYPYLSQGFKTIIGDEIHHAGNVSAQRTRALSWISKYTPYFIGMSGTPILSRPGQFYPILSIIDPTRFSSHRRFRDRYCNMQKDFTGKLVEKSGGNNLAELNHIVSKYMIRREKREILKDLPPKPPRIIVPLEMEHAKEYKTLYLQAKKLESKSAIEKLKYSAFAFKQNLVVEWIANFLETEESLIVFAYHKAVLSFLQEHFKEVCVRIDGDIVGKHRENAIRLFKERKKQLMIGQVEAMGEAIDGLQEVCNNCAFVEFAKTATKHDQAESRLDRSGQRKGVNCYYLIAEGSIDEDQMYILDQQTKMYDKVVRGKDVSSEDDLLSVILKNWRNQNENGSKLGQPFCT